MARNRFCIFTALEKNRFLSRTRHEDSVQLGAVAGRPRLRPVEGRDEDGGQVAGRGSRGVQEQGKVALAQLFKGWSLKTKEILKTENEFDFVSPAQKKIADLSNAVFD